MPKPSQLAKVVNLINSKVSNPSLKTFCLSAAFNSQIKYAGTSGIRIHSLTPEESVVSIKNRMRVQNHIGGVHACAMAVLAESATGTVFTMNVSGDHIPLIKSMKVNYNRRAKGDLKAVATLSAEQRAAIAASDKGDVTVPVVVTDESGASPITCEMTWAWVPKKRD